MSDAAPPTDGPLARARLGVVGLVRRFGREIAMTPDFMGFGNLLLMALWADEGLRTGRPRWSLETPALTPWLEVFPALRRLFVHPDDVRRWDRPVRPWRESAKAAAYGSAYVRGFDDAEMDAFVRAYLLGPVAQGAVPEEDGRLVVNVRRGDYYADPEIREQYGFDQEGYLAAAIARATDRAPVTEIAVVSDGPQWCRENLGWLEDVAPTHVLGGGPVDDFLAVARARRAVITNSTFSYWAAYVGNVLHPGDHHVVVPRFFDRSQNDGRAWLLDERWDVVEELPDGWGA